MHFYPEKGRTSGPIRKCGKRERSMEAIWLPNVRSKQSIATYLSTQKGPWGEQLRFSNSLLLLLKHPGKASEHAAVRDNNSILAANTEFGPTSFHFSMMYVHHVVRIRFYTSYHFFGWKGLSPFRIAEYRNRLFSFGWNASQFID